MGAGIALTMQAPTGVNFQTATLHGTLLDIGSTSPVITFYWGETNGGTDPAAWDHAEDLGTRNIGTFQVTVAPRPNTFCWCRIKGFCAADAQTVWSSAITTTANPFATPSLHHSAEADYGKPSEAGNRTGIKTFDQKTAGMGDAVFEEASVRTEFSARFSQFGVPITWKGVTNAAVTGRLTSSPDGNRNHDVRFIEYDSTGTPNLQWIPTGITGQMTDSRVGAGVQITPQLSSGITIYPDTVWIHRQGIWTISVAGYVNPTYWPNPVALKAYAIPRRSNATYLDSRSLILNTTVPTGDFSTVTTTNIHLRACPYWSVIVGVGINAYDTGLGIGINQRLWELRISSARTAHY